MEIRCGTHHNHRRGLADFTSTLQFLLLLLKLDAGLAMATGNFLKIDTSSVGQIMVVAPPDVHH